MTNLITKIWHPAPKKSTDYGEEGWMAKDTNYFYIYTNGKWERRPVSQFKET